MLDHLRPGGRHYLRNYRGLGKTTGLQTERLEKAVFMGKAYRMAEAGMTLNHPKFPQYVSKLIPGKMAHSSPHPPPQPFTVLGFGDRRSGLKERVCSYSLGLSKRT